MRSPDFFGSAEFFTSWHSRNYGQLHSVENPDISSSGKTAIREPGVIRQKPSTKPTFEYARESRDYFPLPQMLVGLVEH